MGIPRLYRRLRDAGDGHFHELGRTGSGTEAHTNALIDGPSLAHHVFQRMWERSEPAVAGGAESPFTYAQYARATVEWLDALRSCGFEIEAIFFDGALPARKREVRVERLARCAGSLAAYKTLHDGAVKAQPGRRSGGPADVWSWPVLGGRARRELPPPPFLVPAVVEALLVSRYADVTHVVPDEADVYCVLAAREAERAEAGTDAVTFSDDSDLLVFDCGERSRVAVLNELTVRTDEQGSVLHGWEFSPAQMARRTSCPDLIAFAWYMSQDVNLSVHAAQQRVKLSRPLDHREYREFAGTYQVEHHEGHYRNFVGDKQRRKLLNGLDARVSEMVHQLALLKPTQELTEIDVFLPFLRDDPTRSTAWRIGARTRQIAYMALLQASKFYGTSINEYRRNGRSIKPTRLDGLDEQPIETRLLEWCSLAGDIIEITTEGLSEIKQWRAFVAQFMLRDMEREGMTLPPADELVLVLTGRGSNSWNVAHLVAQFEAAFYSLRMLSQILRYVQEVPTSGLTALENPYQKPIEMLHQLPSIAAFFEPEIGAELSIEMALWMPITSILLQQTGAPHEVARNETKAEKTHRKRKKLTNGKRAESVAHSNKEDGFRTSNPFAMLAN